MLKDSRKNLRNLSRTVTCDLGALEKAATRGTAPTTARWTGPGGGGREAGGSNPYRNESAHGRKSVD